ncbi:MAG: hypothetical protein GEU79_03985 [Acidimicrobiia bacterium]|nr:hypothetical protein [Acidimicrobiia bacterium]
MALTRLRSVGPPPMAVDAAYEIAEDKSVAMPVGTIDASGPDDDTVTFSITTDKPDGVFAIDEATCAVTFPAPLAQPGFPLRSGGDGEERKQP